MGIVSTTLSQSNNMKFLLVLAVAAYARAEAEAKPGFVYTTGHLPLAYGYHPYALHHPLVYTAPVGCQNNEGVAVPCAHGGLRYAAHPYGYGYYGHGLGYAGLGYYGYGHHLGYAGYYGHHLGYYGKREAEAEPTAEADADASPEADPWLYYSHAGYGLHPYGYGYYGHGLGYAAYAGYHPYSYLGGCRNGYGALVPCAGK